MYAAFSKSTSSKPDARTSVPAPNADPTKGTKPAKSPKRIAINNRQRRRQIHEQMTPLQQFTKTVAIAGLDEAFNHYFKPDRIMFRLALIYAFCTSFYLSHSIYHRFRSQETVFNVLPLKNGKAPFPNVTVCIPFNINQTFYRQVVNISEKAKFLMNKYNITVSETVDYMSDLIVMKPEERDFASPLHMVTRAVVQASTESFSEKSGGESLFKHLAPLCSETLSNCVFDGDSFDCCNAAQLFFVIPHWCYLINLNHIDAKASQTKAENNISKETMHLEKSGFSVDVSTDWTYGHFMRNSSSDGFHVFIDKIPVLSNDPVGIPSGTEALITLAEAQQVKEITECYSSGTQMELKYFDYYDPYGDFCLGDWLEHNIAESIGAIVPMITIFPPATFDHVSVLSLSISAVGNVNETKKIGEKFYDSMAAHLKTCLPLCSRWTYRVMSTGYGYVQYQNVEKTNRQVSTNRTWSRVRVIMPETTWRKHEEARATSYLIMCEIGGMMGAYVGFSMISLAEIFGHGVYVFWIKWRKRRVWPV